MSRLLAGPALMMLLVAGARAADDAKQPEQLPRPRELPSEAVVVPIELSPYTTFVRDNRWDVWQYYGVNNWGYFRPRVAYSPYGSYYLYNGRPYPFDQLYPREWLMTQAGTPNRAPPAYMPYLED